MFQHTAVEQLYFNARTFPGRPALQVVDGPTLSYAQSLDRTLILATAIRRYADGSPVAILQRNGVDAVLAVFACQLAGVPALPVNNALTAPEIDYILNDSSARVLLYGREFTNLVPKLDPANRPVLLCSGDLNVVPDRWENFTPSDPAEPFIIGYTSGTTGFPKGGIYDGEGLYVQYLRWGLSFGITSMTTLLTAGPIFHNSYGGLSILALMVGATNRILNNFDAKMAREELAERCTFAFLVPAMLTQILDAWRDDGWKPMPCLRMLLSSGAAVEPAKLDDAASAFPNAFVSEAYGWSEGGWVTCDTKEKGKFLPQCVGWPMVGADVALFDEHGERCGEGEVGEIGARNVSPFQGYVNPGSPLETSQDGKYLLSGDIGQFARDGRLLVVGRKKEVIVTGGENVASSEVERVLAEHPAVEESAVVGRADARWGEVVTAFIVLAEAVVDEQRLREHCLERLAGYKVPKWFKLVDSLPRNSMGKVQKFLLREDLEAPR